MVGNYDTKDSVSGQGSKFVNSVVDRLRVLKGVMTYSEMEERTGIHSTLLCRYVTGSVRPSKAQARLLWNRLLDVSAFKDKVAERMVFKEGGYLDMHHMLGDPDALRWVAGEVFSKFQSMKADKVLTAASSGISLATAIALQLNLPIIFATQGKTAGSGSYYESELPSSNPSEVFTLYLPAPWVRKAERILIVDDVATSGRTMAALIDLVLRAGCTVVGIVVLASRGTGWKERVTNILKSGVPTMVLFEFTK